MDPKLFYGTKRYSNLRGAVEDISSVKHQNNVDVVVLPPLPDEMTDEEEHDDDLLDTALLPEDVPGEVELFDVMHSISEGEMSDISWKDDEEAISDSSWASSDNEPLNKKQKKVQEKKLQKQGRPKCKKQHAGGIPKWVHSDPVYSSFQHKTFGADARAVNVVEELKNLTPKEIFEKLVDDYVIQYLVDQSMLYAQQNNHHEFVVTCGEMRSFIAILFLTGYHKWPRERQYWSLDEDLKVEVVSNCMSRNRFQEIKRFIHLADKSKADTSNDRLYKVRPLMDILIVRFQQWGVFHEKLSIDEAMVKYFGHHPAKQYIRGKPVRFGFKDWMLCSSCGYCYVFDTYCGKSAEVDPDLEQHPLGSQVVLQLVRFITHPLDHTLFFDNFFTSHSLLVILKEKGFRATGTLRDNRLKQCPIVTVKDMKKNEKGMHEFVFDKEHEVLIVRWKDNNVVTMATNCDSVLPLAPVKRWSKSLKRKAEVEQPAVIKSYNEGMGGVDLHDQSVSTYRIAIRGKKWWWVLFTHMLNVAMTNAWKLHLLASPNKMDQLSFTRNVTRSYLRISRPSTSRTKQNTRVRNPASVIRGINTDGSGHFPKKLEKQLRCHVCHARIRWACKTCNITLCVEKVCFEQFHVV